MERRNDRFDSYHYRYDSGREGDAQAISFYPRKGKITVYLMDGTARYAELLADLGALRRAVCCLKRLSDIEVPVLEEILRQSYANVKSEGSGSNSQNRRPGAITN